MVNERTGVIYDAGDVVATDKQEPLSAKAGPTEAIELKRLQGELNDLTHKFKQSEKLIAVARNKYPTKDTLQIYKLVISDYASALIEAKKDLANLTMGDSNVRDRLLINARTRHPEEDEKEIYRIVIDELRRGR